MNKLRILSLLAAATMLAGCVTTEFTTPDGWTAKRRAFGLNASVGEVEVRNGEFSARMRGYQSDGVEAIRAAAQGVAEGLANGITPTP